MRFGRVFPAIALGLCVAGCNSGLARQMVTAPNRRLSAGPDTRISQMKDGRFFVGNGTGDDAAVIAGWVIEPKLNEGQAVKGTIVLMHGFLADHTQLRGAADVMAEAGYRAVMVDLRGHGQSTGRHITYGVVESRDMVAVLDYLQKQNFAGDTIGVYGTSLGAATAIQWAAIDPRVRVVVAIASFATLRDEAPHFAKVILPLPGAFLARKDIDEILTRAGQIAHFDIDAASPLRAIAQTQAKILLLHGDGDAIVSLEDSKRLHAANPASELGILDWHGHWAVAFDWGGETSRRAREFFDTHLVEGGAAAR